MVRLRVDGPVAADDGAVVWPVYESVFGDYSDDETWRGAVRDKHSVRDGFRIARAYHADALVGFACGYPGAHGQWWTDNARKAGRGSGAQTGATVTFGQVGGRARSPLGRHREPALLQVGRLFAGSPT